MKAFSDLEQSKKLSEILPFDTADMWYSYYGNSTYNPTITYKGEQWFLCQIRNSLHSDIPCWSLSALLELIWEKGCTSVSIPKLYQNKPEGGWYISAEGLHYETSTCNCIIDAAFEIICWLKENNKI